MTGRNLMKPISVEGDFVADGAQRVRSCCLEELRFVETTYARNERMPRHAHGVTKISLLLAGGLEERTRRKEWMPPVCGLVIKPAGLDHMDRFSPHGARLFSIQMEAVFVNRLGPHGRALESYNWIPTGLWTRSALLMYRLFREAAPERPPSAAADDPQRLTSSSAQSQLESTLYDLIAALPGARAGVDQPGPEPRWLKGVRDRLHDELRAGTSARHLANDVGVHPVHLARVFRRRFGCTIAEYVRRLRAEHAAALLASTDLPIAAVADETGFADQPHLNRTFKALTGVTPLAYRRLARS